MVETATTAAFQTCVSLFRTSWTGGRTSLYSTKTEGYRARRRRPRPSKRPRREPPIRCGADSTPPPSSAGVRDLLREVRAYSGGTTDSTRFTSEMLNQASALREDESIALIYKALYNGGHLRHFGKTRDDVRATADEKASIASNLSNHTGLPSSALTPRQQPVLALQLGTIALLSAIAYATRTYHLPSIRPFVYTALVAATLDQIALRGALFDAAFAKVNPGHRTRVATHEAGHFLMAYLQGLPVQSYALSAMEALQARVPGQAMTIFEDDELATQLQEGQLGSKAVDRYCVVAMAGIAAEGLLLGEAVGGDADVNSVFGLLQGLSPPWVDGAVRVQARWAVARAVQTLREYRGALERLRVDMAEGRSMGECVMGIEQALTG